MKKSLFVAFLLFTLCACGDDGDSALTLADIAGVWDDSTVYSSTIEDEWYIVIKPDGTITDYDYYGDTFDQGDDCYYKSESIITDLGGGNFEIIDEDGLEVIVHASISGNQLVFKVDNDTYAFPQSPLQESDFTPLCY